MYYLHDAGHPAGGAPAAYAALAGLPAPLALEVLSPRLPLPSVSPCLLRIYTAAVPPYHPAIREEAHPWHDRQVRAAWLLDDSVGRPEAADEAARLLPAAAHSGESPTQ